VPGEDIRGRLDAMILSVVEETPLHGYAVISALEDGSGGRLQLATGTVYPALRRLERSGLIQGEWATVGGRRRRTYRITSAGRRALGDERAAWVDFTRLVGGILGRHGPPVSGDGQEVVP
jgi:PadR family transcriptional regulator, regulatory protein PadR